MKTAILVYGEFREFENSHKTWWFLNNFDYDIYVNTWDVTKEKNDNLKIDIVENVSEDRIIRYFPNAIINIEKTPPYSTGTLTIYHWRKLFKMMLLSGKEYDNVILLRSDLVVKCNNNIFNNQLLENEDDRTIYCLSDIALIEPPVFVYVQDLLFYGKTKTMTEIFLSMCDPDITRKDIHYHFGKHLINNDVHVKSLFPHVLDYFVMRYVHREHLDLDFDSQKRLSNDWWIAKHKNVISEYISDLLKLER